MKKMTLTTLRRDLNGYLEGAGASSGVTNLPEHTHVMNDEEESVKEEENTILMTTIVRCTSHYQLPQGYSKQGAASV